jgi:hypothetical protein
MTSRLELIAAQQSSIAKKVLDVVPLQQAWSVRQILSELARLGLRYELKAVTGCLSSLKDSGLVKEPKIGTFIRTPLGARESAHNEKPPVSHEPQPPPGIVKESSSAMDAKVKDPLGRLLAATNALRDAAKQLNAVANEAEDAALALQQEVEAANADNNKLHKLRDILKSLT